MNKNEKGFGAPTIMLVILIVGVLCLAGWYVYQANNKKDTTSTQQPAATTEKTSQPSAQTPANTGFYEIKDWNIKIALQDSDKVQFEVKNQSGTVFGSDPYESYADPSFKPAFLKDPSCDPGIALYRSKAKFASVSDDNQKKVGDYYYVITGGPGACSNDPQNNPDDQLKNRFLKDMSDIQNISSS